MTTEEIVYSTLSTWEPLTDLVANRISLMRALDGGAYPCVTYLVIGCHIDYTQDGESSWADPVVQIDSWCLSDQGANTVVAVSAQVLAAIRAYNAASTTGESYIIENDGHDHDDPSRKLFRRMVQVRLWRKQ